MNIHALVSPRSIAVIGASTELGSVGNDIVKNLVEQKFIGDVYPVNPKATELYGLQCFPNIASIGKSIDLAIIAVPAKIVPLVLQEIIAEHISAAIVISAGFREAGNTALEEEITTLAREADMALLGPNCLGIVAPPVSMNASFAKTLPKRGSVAFLSQSGALGTAILDMAADQGIGISFFASLGNKALLDESAFLEYIASDRKTSVVAIYAEDFRQPAQLKILIGNLACIKKPKPVIVLKSGKTNAGQRASSSHTGSLAGNAAAYEALFEEAGCIEAQEARELFSYARVFEYNSLPQGGNIAIVTNAGGPGVLAADAAALRKSSLAPLSENTIAELRSFLPEAAGVLNPVDILGDAKSGRYGKAIESVLRDESVGSLLVILTPQSMTDVENIAEAIVHAKHASKKPIVAAFLGGKLVEKGRKILRKGKVATAEFPEEGIAMLTALERFASVRTHFAAKSRAYEYHTLTEESAIRSSDADVIFQTAKNRGASQLSPIETLQIFEHYGFPVPRYASITNREEGEQLKQQYTSNVAMKILSETITHKSDAGGVMLNVAPDTIPEAFDTMIARVRANVPDARLDGVLVMEMAPKGGMEIILGTFHDPNLGPVGMVGAGGIYTEILKDTTFGLLPISQDRAETLLQKLKIFPILDGARGGEPLDRAAIVEAIGRLSKLITDHPLIDELDINPLLVFPKGKGVLIVDGRISVR